MVEEFKGFGLQKQDPNVTKKRNVYCGGSDIPTILGINKYKTQFELALEKTGIVEREFISNEYIKFGNMLEPSIRDYTNAINGTNFIEETYIDEEKAIRSNVDGIDKEENILLEIKTHGANPTMKVYEVQMQLYMYQSGADVGWLALYKRPKNFDTEFDADNLQIKEINRDEELIEKILESVELFWERCELLKLNPKMDEAEYMAAGSELDVALAKLNNLAPALIEAKAQLKQIEQEEKELKNYLYEQMEENDIKKMSTPLLNITRVLPSKSMRFDSKAFKEEHPDLHEKYLTESNRKGYVKLTEVTE